MASNQDLDAGPTKKSYAPHYDGGHQVPTVQKYRALKEEREAEAERPSTPSGENNASPKSITSKRKSILTSAKGLLRTGSRRSISGNGGRKEAPYPAENRNANGSTLKTDQSSISESTVSKAPADDDPVPHKEDKRDVTSREEARPSIANDTPVDSKSASDQAADEAKEPDHKDKQTGDDATKPLEDTSEATATTNDPQQKRKVMKKRDEGPEQTSREVTDPVTHLCVTIHDSTINELESAPENLPPPNVEYRSSTGVKAEGKPREELQEEERSQELAHRGMQKLFPPPDFESTKDDIANIYIRALWLAMGSSLAIPLALLVGAQFLAYSQDDRDSWIHLLIGASVLLILGLLSALLALYILQGWTRNRIYSVWEDHVWEAARTKEAQSFDSKTPESVQWLNSLLTSLWGLINPDMFTSLMDMIEDVMQASLPKLVRMVSVDDLGQGSESLRILGVRWLPTGAAAENVAKDGDDEGDAEQNDDGETPDNDKGLEAEDGDFVNVEVAFSYRASTKGTKLTQKTKNAHLVLAFYLPGGVKLPVWAELKGLIGTVRLRLQLTPDPPFFSLCTLTFLGQPKVDLSCIPLTKKGLNIMDLPLISNFVQSSVDAALSSYVAPHSLSLDLKAMLVGDDFKRDTDARGVLMVTIKQGRDFKEGDSSMLGLGDGSSDPYVAVGWAKFGKPIWSTRIIMADMQPIWKESAFLLVTPEELNADEKLRIQLWDSDRGSADDDLGRIELDLKEIMNSSKSKGKMWERTDGFQALDDKEKMPGTLDWAVGYFEKSRIRPEQFERQKVEEDVRSLEQLKEKVSKDTERKLREATDRSESQELRQQKAQDLREREDAMIISTPPLHDHSAGIFAIQIHQITGVEYGEKSKQSEGDEDAEEGEGDLPSPYCTIILNHQKIFRTRTKPKNAKPFFNAGTERFIKCWKTTDILISVRDSRVHENDALLGIVHLPLGKILKHQAQVVGSYPLVGGIGHGRARISLLFRSVDLVLPKTLIGWDYGTLELAQAVTSKDLPSSLHGLRLKLRTTISRGKMYTPNSQGDAQQWSGKKGRPVFLAVRKRYSSCMVLEFRKSQVGVDATVAFGVLWLKDIADDEDTACDVPIWKADKERVKRATTNVVEDPDWERLGTLHVPLAFRPGLGSYHEKLASKSPSLQDVFETLRTADENQEIDFGSKNEEKSDSSSDSDSSDSDSDASVNDGKGGPVKKIKSYRRHADQLHRQERGVMQWKGARTADYLKTKVEHGKDNVIDRFRHHAREPDVETEA